MQAENVNELYVNLVTVQKNFICRLLWNSWVGMGFTKTHAN